MAEPNLRPSYLPANEIYDAPASCGQCWGPGPPEQDVASLMTPEEVAGIAELAEMYAVDGTCGGAAEPDGLTLLRFLRARKMDKAAALKQLISERMWRQRNDVDNLLLKRDPCEAIFSVITPHAHHGFSKAGMPLYYERSGEAEVPVLLTSATRKQCALRHVWHMEVMSRRMSTSSDPEGKPVTKQIEIRDLKGLAMSPNSAAMQLFKDTIYIDQTFYPERLGKLFLINAPYVFAPIYAIIKPWVDVNTIKKFVMCHSIGTAELLKEIDAAILPVEYGGEDPFQVPHKRKYGGFAMRHIEYHHFQLRLQDADIKKSATGGEGGPSGGAGAAESGDGADAGGQATARDGGADSTGFLALPDSGADFYVGARSSTDVPTRFENTGSTLDWVLSLKSHNIQLTISFVNDGGEETVVQEMVKTDSMEGRFVSPGPGTLTLKLDNSYSMLRSKTVNLAATISDDGDEQSACHS